MLFAPTHRESKLARTDYDERMMTSFLEQIAVLDKKLQERRFFLIFKPHYLSRKFRNFPRFSNIKVSHDTDPRLLMLVSDILVTDYSSIYVDYLLLQRPIVFYQPDLEYYQHIRGLVVDPKNPIHMPGPKISKLSQILELKEEDFKSFDLEKSRAFFHKYWDDRASERLASFLQKLLSQDDL
ncbi:CDP-glycerol glycerophosphotransferase family protein [Fervidobacterium thailandense]|uniref:CDP-glycerol glycerophosphotransferase family protein n=1 Tax=Fervidobacterium thailandense TaxID=1008305 RepID=UPI00355B96F9